jgi:hypothetical protein
VVPRGPAQINQLWPHFTKQGGTERISDSEWASGDTAYALLDLFVALQMIGDPQSQLPTAAAMLQGIDWAALHAPNGGFYHGYGPDGTLLTGTWRGFGTETLGVILAALAGKNILGDMGPPPSDNGSGFILHAAYPIVPTGVDRWGNNWYAIRRQETEAQLQWYSTAENSNSYLAALGMFGLSAAERPEGWDPDPAQIYQAFGSGGTLSPQNDGSNRVVVLHYGGMIASMQRAASEHMWGTLRQMGIVSPMNNMESMSVDPATGLIEQVNYLRGSWTLALQAEGWALAHSQVAQASYDAFRNVPLLAQAYGQIFPKGVAVTNTATGAIEVGAGVDQFDTVQMCANPINHEIDLVHTRLETATGRRGVWFVAVGTNGYETSQIGYCYSNQYWYCPVAIAVNLTTGQPAVAYRGENGELVFAHLEGNAWFSEEVATFGWNCSLAFDPSDNQPAIAFNSMGDYNLYYAKRGTCGWVVSLLTWDDACDESLRFHPNTGQRCISYQTLGWTMHPSTLQYWGYPATSYVPSDSNYVGAGNSLAFDANGYPHVTHFDHTSDCLKHTWCNGAAWATEVVDVGVDGYVTSLASDGEGRFFASYASTLTGARSLRFASHDQSQWQVQTLSTASDVSPWSSVAVTGDGSVHVAFIAGETVNVREVRPQEDIEVSREDTHEFIMHCGVNLPWINYGWDFGANPWGGSPGGFHNTRAALEEDVAYLRGKHVKLCRVFLFCDFRTGLNCDTNGNIVGLDPYVVLDMQTLLEVAATNDIRIIPVLMDRTLADGVAYEGSSKVGEHPEYITNALLRAQLFANVLVPFVNRFGTNASIYAWDVMNEPSLATAVPQAALQSFIVDSAALITNASPGSSVCIGNYDRYHLDDYGNAACSLTQLHYYQHMTNYWDFNTPAQAISDKPTFFGEVDPVDVAYKLSTALSNHYAAVLFWSLNGNDGHDFRAVADSYAAWASSVFADVNQGLCVTGVRMGGQPQVVSLDVSPTYGGAAYRLESCNDLRTGEWLPAASFSGCVGTNVSTVTLQSGTETQRFYRVVASF